MSKIKSVQKVTYGYSPKGTNYAKGDYIETTTVYSIRTNDGRQCITNRSHILEFIAEILGMTVKNVTESRLSKLRGQTLKESIVLEESRYRK